MASSSEKTLLGFAASSSPTQSSHIFVRWRRFIGTVLLSLCITCYFLVPIWIPSWRIVRLTHHDNTDLRGSCEQARPIYPQSFDVSSLVQGEEGQIRDWLSGAVKVPTEIFDVMGEVGEDPRWDVFFKFADYMEKAFPLVHQQLTRTRVMTHALIFEWQGSDTSLKPLLLTGHQDVVPVLNATRGLWSHDPYGGEYDPATGLIWGRGSSDDKSGTIGLMSAVELLLKSGKFTPTRTVILAFGDDEETSGKVGAHHLAVWLEKKYGKDSMAMLVDEGSEMSTVWGQLFAMPAVGEKGYLDVEVRVETLGGHSSVPPPHTGIGFLSLLIAALEKHPHEPYLNVESPLNQYLSCAANSPAAMPKHLKHSVHKLERSLSSRGTKVDKKALKEIQDWWVVGSSRDRSFPPGMGKAMVSTTQAVDIVNGGVKVNALPEVVAAVVNHRINLASSVTELQNHLVDVLSPVAGKYNLSLTAFGEDVEIKGCKMHMTETKAGKVFLSEAFESSLEPAPISPHTIQSPAWRVLSGTVKGVYATRPEADLSEEDAKKTVIMAPMISTGNTDTRFYWNLTQNIYRFVYQDNSKAKDGFSGVHTVDEHILAEVFVEQVRWFMNFIVNVDESREI